MATSTSVPSYSEYTPTGPIAGASTSASASSSPIPPQWQQPSSTGENRSVTPAMNNTRGASMYPSRGSSPANTPASPSPADSAAAAAPQSAAPHSSSGNTLPSQYNHQTMGHQQHRYFPQTMPNTLHNSNSAKQLMQQNQHDALPSSTGLIRLTLRKPMGIVFEPMYDPNQPSVQKGVRICDLPRTGAAALSRKLEIGDELLSINDKTMSRLTFDEIMDFIIEADPEQVNLLFRRPRKEVLAARNALKTTSSSNATSVKWVDEDAKSPKRDKSKHKSSAPTTANYASSSKKKKNSSNKKERYDDDTLETYDEKPSSNKKGKQRDPYENESFLDLLIDTICANPDYCKSSDRHGEHEYDSYEDEEDDRTLTSYDDSTYVTYESDKEKKSNNNAKDKTGKKVQRQPAVLDSETEDDTLTDDDARHRSKVMNIIKPYPPKAKPSSNPKKLQPYEDDETLETTETTDQIPAMSMPPSTDKIRARSPPVGRNAAAEVQPVPSLAAPDSPKQPMQQHQEVPIPVQISPPMEDEKNKAPITELEYDDQVEADVSVMESLGGPSLVIEQRRQQAIVPPNNTNVVPADIINEFGSEYPADFGYTREQTIGRDPIRFYAFVVKKLLEQHEPEKVRLLDKLLAKYKGREDHLVQKLSVRYQRNETPPEEQKEIASFSEAVNKNKEKASTERTVQKAQERAAATFQGPWPDKESKEPEPVDTRREESEEESEFSGESIDGTSPAVIAQVSELLNYVYGKTSVPGQIDRVSTIMRAYEGREAVLLELLETKALIKANSEKENAANLPSFLRNSPALNQNREDDMVSPLSSPNTGMNQQPVGGNIINDDISSMSGVSSPAPENAPKPEEPQSKPKILEKPSNGSHKESKRAVNSSSIANHNTQPVLSSTPVVSKEVAPSATLAKQQQPQLQDKKKKGLFGGLFTKKNRKGGIGGIRSKGDEQGSI